MKKIYNVDQVVWAEKVDRVYGEVSWRRFWKKGYYARGRFLGKALPDHFAKDEKGVYRRPSILIRLSDGSSTSLYYHNESSRDASFVLLARKFKNIFTDKL